MGRFGVVLGLSRGATRIEIKKAYHAKRLAYHPDKVAMAYYNRDYLLERWHDYFGT